MILSIFIDETSKKIANGKRFIFSLVALPQDKWSGLISGHNLPSRLPAITEVIKVAQGIGVIVYADIDSEFLNKKYATADIARIASQNRDYHDLSRISR